jgi:hypothetical protein
VDRHYNGLCGRVTPIPRLFGGFCGGGQVIQILSFHLPLSPLYSSQNSPTFHIEIFKLHGMPQSIISDQDPIFTSLFWQDLFRLQGTSLNLSTSYYPQTDGQTEVVNKCLENYLRYFAANSTKQWTFWLPWAEYWYNTIWHSFIKMTPYEAVYGVPPLRLLSYVPGTTKVEAVDELLRNCEQILNLLQQNIKQGQHRMKKFADLKCS